MELALAYAWAVFFAFTGAKMVGFGLKTSADMMADGERAGPRRESDAGADSMT